MKKKVFLIKNTDMPNMASHCKQDECGFSVYRGVLVQWDEDHDERVLNLLDDMPAWVIDELLCVQEHEGSAAFVWKRFIPNGYTEDDQIEPGDGDIWSIYSSKTIDAGAL
ncbi:MAG TPA: hypothetical protein PKI71_06380 [Candidatus Rifleibacterium sp.]|nr:hypothetical protein [Candidatus Rifleibacterium sp.]